MAEPTLQQVFGANASQNATTLTISKADLSSIGLTSNATNTSESLWVAILLQAASYLTETNQQNNADQSISIVESFDSLVTRNNQTYRQKTYSVNLQRIDTGSTINPNDY